jgi:hypothetical protein
LKISHGAPPSNRGLFREVITLKERGYDIREIAIKVGRDTEYVAAINRLIERDEAFLVQAVEANRIPVTIALLIASAARAEASLL